MFINSPRKHFCTKDNSTKKVLLFQENTKKQKKQKGAKVLTLRAKINNIIGHSQEWMGY